MMNALYCMNDLNASDLFELMPKDTNEGAAHVAQQALQDGAGLIMALLLDDTKAVCAIRSSARSRDCFFFNGYRRSSRDNFSDGICFPNLSRTDY